MKVIIHIEDDCIRIYKKNQEIFSVTTKENVEAEIVNSTLETIYNVVRQQYPIDFRSRNRKRERVLPRHYFFYLAVEYSQYSTNEIGTWLNPEHPFDHATVLHGKNAIINLKDTDKVARDVLASLVENLKKELNK